MVIINVSSQRFHNFTWAELCQVQLFNFRWLQFKRLALLCYVKQWTEHTHLWHKNTKAPNSPLLNFVFLTHLARKTQSSILTLYTVKYSDHFYAVNYSDLTIVQPNTLIPQLNLAMPLSDVTLILVISIL